MAAARSRSPSFAKMCPMWVFTVPSLMKSVAADLGVAGSATDQLQHVSLVLGELGEPGGGLRTRDRRRAVRVEDGSRHRRIEPGTATANGARRADQVLAGRVLEQEAAAPAPARSRRSGRRRRS